MMERVREMQKKWEAEGSPDTYKKANAVWKRMLSEYQPPPLDEAIAEELNAFAESRRAEIRDNRPRIEWKRYKT